MQFAFGNFGLVYTLWKAFYNILHTFLLWLNVYYILTSEYELQYIILYVLSILIAKWKTKLWCPSKNTLYFVL